MRHILIIGAGKIGSLITYLLASSKDYLVYLADIFPTNPQAHLKKYIDFEYVTLDAKDQTAILNCIKQHQIEALVSSLPFYCNLSIAEVAAKANIAYFDLTEDVQTTEKIIGLAEKATHAFVPQCGLAPGFINIVANDLMQTFNTLDSVKLRVGALPINVSNALQYALTWSTEGLINEYGNPCHAIENKKAILCQPLEGLEEIMIDGVAYEAFNTSGGVASLVQTYEHKVNELNYKTIRYKGHCEKMKFLMNDLHLNQARDVLKHILEEAIPTTAEDKVIIYVSVTGWINDKLTEKVFLQTCLGETSKEPQWTAIQLTTASSICAVIDLVLNDTTRYRGFVRQEDFTLTAILTNQFGKYYAK